MNWEQLQTAYSQAQSTINLSDRIVGDMARMIVGRLRRSNVGTYTLIALKKELNKFNMHTKEWMD